MKSHYLQQAISLFDLAMQRQEPLDTQSAAALAAAAALISIAESLEQQRPRPSIELADDFLYGNPEGEAPF